MATQDTDIYHQKLRRCSNCDKAGVWLGEKNNRHATCTNKSSLRFSKEIRPSDCCERWKSAAF